MIMIILKCAARRSAQPPSPASVVLHHGGANTPSLISMIKMRRRRMRRRTIMVITINRQPARCSWNRLISLLFAMSLVFSWVFYAKVYTWGASNFPLWTGWWWLAWWRAWRWWARWLRARGVLVNEVPGWTGCWVTLDLCHGWLLSLPYFLVIVPFKHNWQSYPMSKNPRLLPCCWYERPYCVPFREINKAHI